MIAFCTTCKGRVHHLEQTLRKNLADNADYPGCRFVIVDYGCNDVDGWKRIQEEHEAAICTQRVVIYDYPAADKFRMAHAKNMAHRCGMLEGAVILCNLDADNFTGPGFARLVAEQCKPDTFLWSGIVVGKGRQYRGCSGRIAVTAENFVRVGGYDERYSTWSPDDKDFNARLEMIGLRGISIPLEHLRTVWHGNGIRFQEYPEVLDNEGEEAEVNPLIATVNNGCVGLGTVYRNYDTSNPIELKPISYGPTRQGSRVFGIGMHKTATMSLHAALGILGYKSAHWPTPGWAKRVWLEMRDTGRSPTMEKYDALVDLPFTFLYKELDRAYPGSKFILSVRPEEDWLRSVRDHFSDRNEWRKTWDGDPFSHKCHTLLYGQKEFNEEVMLNRYRRHNQEVKEYFAGRNDCAVLPADASSTIKWHTLCSLLNKPVPVVSYPEWNVTATNERPIVF